MSVHELLLELAGRLDDDLLAWARELVAVGEEGQAVELAVAALVAEQVALPGALRAAVVRAGHTDLDADAELAPAADGAPEHRFDATVGPGDRVAAVLAALPARRLAGCTLHLTWRLTPAGAVPGPVPRPVVLVETGPDRSADVLAYLLATELERAGVPASVEVVADGVELPAYHAAALRSAQRIEVGAAVIAPAGVVVARTAAEAAARAHEPAEVRADEAANAGADTASLFVVPSDAGEARRTGRRRKREPAAAEVPEPVPEPVAGPDDAPDTDPFQGPLRVPLLAPLLDPTTPDDFAPAAVPTPIRPVPAQPAAPEPITPEPITPEPITPEPVTPEPAEADGRAPVAPVEAATDAPIHAAADPAVEVPDEVPQEWEDDWRSGEWAMPPGGSAPADGFDVFETPAAPADGNAVEETGRTELPQRTPGRPELPQRTPERPEPALPTRTRRSEQPNEPSPGDAGASLFDSPTTRVSPAPRPAPGEVPLFGETPRRPEGPRHPEGLPPDPAGRRRRPDPAPEPAPDAEPSVLSSTERDLLAQLQAELADRERRPRPYRRARTPAVNGHGTNGHGVNGHGTDGPAPNGDTGDPAGG